MDLANSLIASSATAAGDPEDGRARELAIANKLASAAMWDIVQLFMHSPGYDKLTLADLKWALFPAVSNRQYTLIQVNDAKSGLSKPVALICWASVSSDIDAAIRNNLGKPLMLDAGQRKSGNHHWLTDALGDQTAIGAAVSRLKKDVIGDQPLHSLRQSAESGWQVVAV